MSVIARLARALWSTPWLILAAMAAIFGANGTAARLAIGQVSPLALVSLRWLIVTALLGLMLKRSDWREVGRLMRSHPFLLGWMGLLGFSGFNALYYVAAYRTSALNLTLVQTSIPVFVLAGSGVFFHIRIRPLQIAGMLLTFLGVLIVSSKGNVSRLSALSLNGGDALVLIACVFYAAYTLGLRTRPPGPPLVFYAGTAIASALWSLPMVGGEIIAGQAYWPSLNGWVLALFIALGPSFSAQLFYLRGVDLVGPARAGLFANLIPIFGALSAVLILHESFTVAHGLAVVLGLGGISLAEWQPRRRSADHAVTARDPGLPQADQRRDREFHG